MPGEMSIAFGSCGRSGLRRSPLFLAASQHQFHGARKSLKQKVLFEDPAIQAWAQFDGEYFNMATKIQLFSSVCLLLIAFIASSISSYLGIYSDFSASNELSAVMNESNCKAFKGKVSSMLRIG